MPLFRLSEAHLFPPPHLATPEGLLALGGDLSVPRLLLAYTMGIFPWFSPGDPLLWWSPDLRCVLELDELRISRSLRKVLRRAPFEIRWNQAFDQVLSACSKVPRTGQQGTWITDEMRSAYLELHRQGYAHSVECWQQGTLVGGLYGLSLGRFFFGESMFSLVPEASKVALVSLVSRMREEGGELLDCQMPTPHLESMGARSIPRDLFLKRLVAGGLSPSTRPSKGAFSFCEH